MNFQQPELQFASRRLAMIRFVGIALVVTALTGSIAAPNNMAEQTRFIETYNKWHNFKCYRPRPETCNISANAPTYVLTKFRGGKFSPEGAIVDRCNSKCGTCGKDKVCSPFKLGRVNYTFVVLYLGDDGNTKVDYVDLSFTQHKQCKCQMVTSDSEKEDCSFFIIE